VAPNPHARRLALLMLDNLVELLLRWHAEFHLGTDRTTWLGLRAYSEQTRRGVDRWHAALLRFARSKGWLEDADVDALTYCHRVRNSAYHAGDVNDDECELAVLLLADFLRSYLPEHEAGRGITILTSTACLLDEIDGDASGMAYVHLDPPDAKARRASSLEPGYWNRCVEALLPPESPDRISTLLASRVAEIFDRAIQRLDFIDTDGVEVGLYDVVESRFFNAGMMARPDRKAPALSVTGALNMYLALLPKEGELLDIEDPSQRVAALQEALNSHKPVKRQFTREHLEQQRDKILDAHAHGISEGLPVFLTVHRQLEPVLDALQEMALDLDFHIQHLIDLARGK